MQRFLVALSLLLASACGQHQSADSASFVKADATTIEPGTPNRLCGAATVNTTVCISATNGSLGILNGSNIVRFYTTQEQPSTTLPGATAYYGVGDLSFIAGFNAATEIAFVIQEQTHQAELMYLTTTGLWTTWPGSGLFSVFDPGAIPPAGAGVSN